MFVERWYIFFWWMFDNFLYYLRIANGIMHNASAPSVAVLYTVTKDGIAFYKLPNIDAIVQQESIVGMEDGRGGGIAVLSVEYRVKTFAAHEGKGYYNRTQYQDESP